MRPLAALACVLLIAVGVAGVVAGGADDSPGLQLLGVVAAVAGVWYGGRSLRARRRRLRPTAR
jgi:peptidoglycan/LPS O-acetylase OafA/YrhL